MQLVWKVPRETKATVHGNRGQVKTGTSPCVTFLTIIAKGTSVILNSTGERKKERKKQRNKETISVEAYMVVRR
jgi:hypothetical protein